MKKCWGSDLALKYSKRQSKLYFVVCCAGFAPPLAAYFLSKSVRILPEAYSQRQITFVVDYKPEYREMEK